MSKKIQKERQPNMLLYFALTVVLGWVVYFFVASKGILGNDFWWHIKVGEWIVDNKSIPTTDIFSWYGKSLDIPWTAHEWLSDVIYYFIHAQFGEIGIFIVSVISSCAMIYLLWRAAKPYISQNIIIGILFFVAVSATIPGFFYARPQMFSFFLLYALIWCLYRFYENEQSKAIYTVPLIACIWSNVHGGSSNLAYIIPAMFLMVGAPNFSIGKIEAKKISRKALTKLTLVTVAAVVAILINPIGLRVLLYPYQNQADTVMINSISEWQSPDAKDVGHLIFYFAPIVLLLLGFLAEKKKVRLIDLAIMGAFVFLFLRSVRFIMLWYIVAPFCAFRYTPTLKISEVPRKVELTLVGLIAAVALMITGMGISTTITTARNGELVSKLLQQEVIDVVKEDAPERLFNDYNFGESLIYHDIDTFYDARADLFVYENIMADGVSLSSLVQNNPEAETAAFDPETVIQKYDFDAFLVSPGRALYSYLNSHPEKYRLMFKNETAAYFVVAKEGV